MDIVDKLFERARLDPAVIVYPEGTDARILGAAARATQMGIAVPVVVGPVEAVQRVAAENGVRIEGLRIVQSDDPGRSDKYADAYAAARGVKPAVARRLVQKPFIFAGMMLKCGDADGMIGGATATTATVISAAALTVGLQEGVSTPSSFFIMVVPEFMGERDKVFVFTDCAVNIAPNSRHLAETAIVSALNAKRLLGIEPRLALLSFSTKGSASHPDVDKVAEAVRIAREMRPDLAIDGELQADAALVPAVANRKVKESPVAGAANILVFPDLDAGNIAYKLTQYLAGARAIGPIMQGFARPVNDLSRGATVEDVLGVTAITSILARQSGEERAK